MNFKLTDEDRKLLREIQRNEEHKRNYVKVTMLLMLDMEETPERVSAFLGLSSSQIYRNIETYKEKGRDYYLESHYTGYWGQLDSFQLAALKQELEANLYLSSKEIGDWIKNTFGVEYTPEGLVPLLHRLGFSYKKTKEVPCEANLENQKTFIQEFEKLKNSLKDDEALYFGDAVHPQHNTRAAYGWISRGEEKEVLSVSGRARININGLLNANDPCDVVAIEGETINAQNTIELYKKLETKHPEKRVIYVISDNARYYRSKLLQEYLKTSRIKQVFLPPYSPNLNIIERLWKFMRKKVINTTFYRHFADFRKAVLSFLENIGQYKEELITLLTLKFQLFRKPIN